ncbi:MAG TPA: hypothetical protein VK152_00300 [Paludibacter sp.]|nr:hypothetical protein [Paludibacter sp.]
MIYDIEYEGGHPLWAKPVKMFIEIPKSNDSILLKPYGFLNTFSQIKILKEDIIDISFDKISTRSAGKTVVGALIGGVLTGGIGLLVGGAIGAKSKNKSQLFLTIKYNEREFTVVLKTGKYTEKVYAGINGLFI